MSRSTRAPARVDRWRGPQVALAGRPAVPRRRALLIASGALFLLLASLLGYRVVHLGRIYPGVSALGVDLGGRTPAEARVLLQGSFAAYADRPFFLRQGDRLWTPTPRELGLRLDPQAAAATAYLDTRPDHALARLKDELVTALRGHNLAQAGLRVDQGQLAAYLDEVSQQVDRPPANARLSLGDDLRVEIVPARGGRLLSREKLRLQLEQSMLSLRPLAVEMPLEEAAPTVMEGELREAQAAAERMLAVPLTIRFGDLRWTLDRTEIASLLVFKQTSTGTRAGTVVTLDEGRLANLVRSIAQQIDRPALNARFDWAGGALKVLRSGQEGRQVDVPAAVAALREKLSSAERTVQLPVKIEAPTAADGDRRLFAGAQLIMAAGTEYGGGVPERLHNVELAAARLNGVVVGPGQTFSFNAELGPTTLAAGFQVGWGITAAGEQVETVPSVAGGICQVATSLFQAVFWAGYPIEERNYHLYWISRYGEPPRGLKGLDATVDAPTLDFKFTNATASPLLIQSYADGQRLAFSLYGRRPDWQVAVEGPQIDDVVKADPTPVRQEDATLPAGRELQVESAQDGFTATIVRTVTQGSDVRTLRLVSRYRPSRNVILVGPKP